MPKRIIVTVCLLLIVQLAWSQRQLGVKIGIGASEIIHPVLYTLQDHKTSFGPSGQFGLAYRANPGNRSSLFVEITINQLESVTSYRWTEYSYQGNQEVYYNTDTYHDHFTSVMVSFYYGIRVDKVCMTLGPWIARGIRHSVNNVHERTSVSGERTSNESLFFVDTYNDLWMGMRTGVIYALSDRYFIETHYHLGGNFNSSWGNGNDISHQLIVGFRYNFLVADPSAPRRERERPHSRRRRVRDQE